MPSVAPFQEWLVNNASLVLRDITAASGPMSFKSNFDNSKGCNFESMTANLMHDILAMGVGSNEVRNLLEFTLEVSSIAWI